VHPETGAAYTHAALFGAIEHAARGFLKRGIGAGDKVALWAPNVPEWLFSFLGLARIGAITVPIDPSAAPETLDYILAQSESRAIVTLAEGDDDRLNRLARRARSDAPALREIITIGDAGGVGGISAVAWERLMAEGEGVPSGDLKAAGGAVRPEDPVAIMYTSGTTGVPKGVVLNHLGLIHKSLHATDRQGIGPDDRLCLFFPLFHMFGNTCIALAGLLRGASLIMACRRFDPLRILDCVAAEKCTAIYGSPSMLISLLDHPRFRRQEWVSLKKGIIGGGA
jgi:fatty-acyl-CoA synthase